MAQRTGIVVATELIKHFCRILTTYRTAINGVVNSAVTAGTITTLQRDILNTFLDSAQTACNILREVSGY